MSGKPRVKVTLFYDCGDVFGVEVHDADTGEALEIVEEVEDEYPETRARREAYEAHQDAMVAEYVRKREARWWRRAMRRIRA